MFPHGPRAGVLANQGTARLRTSASDATLRVSGRALLTAADVSAGLADGTSAQAPTTSATSATSAAELAQTGNDLRTVLGLAGLLLVLGMLLCSTAGMRRRSLRG